MPLTLSQFIADHKLEMKVTRIDARTDDADFGRGARHFRCTIGTSDGGQMVTQFSQGSAQTKAPTLADVLECLASDASGFANARSFEDWAADYGYGTDSRKAEAIYAAVGKQHDRLRDLLGPEVFDVLLYATERE